MAKVILILFAASFLLQIQANAQTFAYNFSEGYEGWQGDFSDYPVGKEDFYELDFNWTTLPAPLNTNKHSLMMTGNNHSDDLFMFIKRKITGLLPNTIYELIVDVEFASDAPTNSPGVGGAPGEGVTVKAGATLVEPVRVIIDNYYQMNIDKNDQEQPGEDMDVIGHVGVTDTTTEFTLISRTNETHPFSITTNNLGEVWVCIGTDSGYEATTTLYYNQIELTFTSILSIENNTVYKSLLYPNPVSDKLYLSCKEDTVNYEIIDGFGRIVQTGGVYDFKSVDVSMLPMGFYFFKTENSKAIPFIKQ